jgi:divalent metal cation (Fe/Co/Zn/Cd) transporter
MKPHHWPWTFIAFAVIGVACLVVGAAALLGLMKNVHPLFNDDLGGWALIVSAIASFLTGAFPLVLRRLAEQEGA